MFCYWIFCFHVVKPLMPRLAWLPTLCIMEKLKNKLKVVFRWFKFTLKPPYSIMCGKLRLAIWDTSFWTFWLKFGHKAPWDISWDLFWSFLKYVNFWRFQGCLSTFQKMGGLRKSKFSRWRSDHYPLISLVLGGEVPRLNHGPICFPIQNT